MANLAYVPDARLASFVSWALYFDQFDDTAGLPTPDPFQWQEWARALMLTPWGQGNSIPSPNGFEDWREWAQKLQGMGI